MPRITALLADDDAQQLKYLKDLVEHLRPTWEIVATLTDVEAISDAIVEHRPSLCILDVRFGGTTGFAVMNEHHKSQPVIYVTGEPAFALDAFDSAAIDFVVKPIDKTRFARALERAEQRLQVSAAPVGSTEQTKPHASSLVRMLKGRDLVVVPLDGVRYFEADRKYSKVFLEGQEGYLRMGLSSVEANLDERSFWRVHRRYIVNTRQISLAKRDEFGRLFLHMRGRSEALPVSKPFEPLFRDGFS